MYMVVYIDVPGYIHGHIRAYIHGYIHRRFLWYIYNEKPIANLPQTYQTYHKPTTNLPQTFDGPTNNIYIYIYIMYLWHGLAWRGMAWPGLLPTPKLGPLTPSGQAKFK